jgi:hypothetical protein
VVINWENGKVKVEILHLQYFLSHTRRLMQDFEWKSFTHIYRELKHKADQLSKEALECCVGSFYVQNSSMVKSHRAWSFTFNLICTT